MPISGNLINKTYDGTGAQAAVEVDPSSKLNIGIVAGGSDDVDLEVQLVPGGTWFILDEAVAANTLNQNIGPVCAVRLNIATNTSGAVKLEVAQV